MRKSNHIISLVLAVMMIVSMQILVADAKVYKLKIGHANAPLDDSILHVAAVQFKKLVEEYSDGKIQAQVFPSGQLGSDSEMADLTVSGAQDVFVTSINLITNYAQRLDALILPYMFPKNDNYRKAIGELWDYFNDYITKKANMRLIAVFDSGYRHVLSTKPVRTLEDARKMRFRVPPSPIMIKTFESWDIKPTPIEWSELFNAMQLGVVDAFECDDTVLISARFKEVVKYITNNDYMLQVSIVVMSESTYHKFPKDLQKVIDRASQGTQEYLLRRSQELVQHCLDVSVKENGIKVLGPPDDYEEWVKRARSIWPDFYERIGDGDQSLGKEVVQKVFKASQM